MGNGVGGKIDARVEVNGRVLALRAAAIGVRSVADE
jgi:hypothetical protein